MGLLFPWATKEYLLWEMSLGQIITYFNIGTEIKYGSDKKPGEPKKLVEMNIDEIKAVKEDLKKKYGDIES